MMCYYLNVQFPGQRVNLIFIASYFVKLATVITNLSLDYWTIASYWCAVHSKPIRSHRRTKSGTGGTVSYRRAPDWSVDMKPLSRDESDHAASVFGRTRPNSNRPNSGAVGVGSVNKESNLFSSDNSFIKRGFCKVYPPNVWMNRMAPVGIVIRLRSG